MNTTFGKLNYGDKFFYGDTCLDARDSKYIWMKIEKDGNTNCCQIGSGMTGLCYDEDIVVKVSIKFLQVNMEKING